MIVPLLLFDCSFTAICFMLLYAIYIYVPGLLCDCPCAYCGNFCVSYCKITTVLILELFLCSL